MIYMIYVIKVVFVLHVLVLMIVVAAGVFIDGSGQYLQSRCGRGEGRDCASGESRFTLLLHKIITRHQSDSLSVCVSVILHRRHRYRRSGEEHSGTQGHGTTRSHSSHTLISVTLINDL